MNNQRQTRRTQKQHQTENDQPKQKNDESSATKTEPLRRWMLILIVVNLLAWVLILPGIVSIRAGEGDRLQYLLIATLLIPVYILLLYLGRVIAYIYWRFYWWFITCQFTCLTCFTILALIATLFGFSIANVWRP